MTNKCYAVNTSEIVPEIEIDNGIFAQVIIPKDEHGMGMHKVRMLPNAKYKPHTHPIPHYLIVTRGSGWTTYNDNEDKIILSSGALIYIAEDVVHQVGAGEDDMEILVISHNSPELEDPSRMVFQKK